MLHGFSPGSIASFAIAPLFCGSGFDPSPSRRLTRGRTEPLWLR
ncbi:hypothetical protein RESH_04956 [Rhodopirellula europaea SH398]|uniref:Uncharacterized protein n=1 Tax=Rhodopirellula europaea SH398 TaxID=1263868 RepID=M5RZ60_9BACT|nr:hypothetical protein RESH_04956 [Rhodopirellula europaea SH398]